MYNDSLCIETFRNLGFVAVVSIPYIHPVNINCTYISHVYIPILCRLASDSPLNSTRKKVTRVHSNEFRGAQSSHRNALSVSPKGSRRDRSHRHSQPVVHCPSLSPLHAVTPPGSPSPPHIHSEIPPPLPSPRSNRPKAVPPPVIPKSLPHGQSKSKTLPSPLTQGAASASSIQSRQLPLAPGLAISNSDPSLDIDRRPPAPLPNDVSILRTCAMFMHDTQVCDALGSC